MTVKRIWTLDDNFSFPFLPILCIPDIRGNLPLLTEIIRQFEKSHYLIFLGDFLDSTIFSKAQQYECIEMVLNLPTRHSVLFGNHELSYMMGKEMRTNSFTRTKRDYFSPLFKRMKERFKYSIFLSDKNYLITHAGLSDSLKKLLPKEFKYYNINYYHQRYDNPLFWIGSSRGGSHPTGGIFWCALSEFKPIPDITQIFAHSKVDKITNIQNNYCINCLSSSSELLELKSDGAVNIIRL